MSKTDLAVARTALHVQRLEHENARLQRDLDACKAQLMMHLREDNETPDATFQKKYESLFSAIETWVDDVIFEDSKDFRESYDKVFRQEQREGVLEDLGLYATNRMSSSRGSRRRTTVSRLDWDKLVFLGRQKYCSCVILSLVVWLFLEREIFDRHFPIGTPSDDAKSHKRTLSAVGFHEIMEIMDEDDEEAPGPSSRAARWKAETLTALSKTAFFQERRANQSTDLFKELIHQLRTWTTPSSRSLKKLRDSVLEPAIDLHTELKCSRYEYVLEHPFSLSPDDLEREPNHLTLKNISTWRSVTVEQDVKPFNCLFPGLYKVDGSAHEASHTRMELVKPVIIVYKLEEAKVAPSLMPAAYSSTMERSSSDPRDAPSQLTNKSHSFPMVSRRGNWWPSW